jgi:ABC-2 type transport system permease protein
MLKMVVIGSFTVSWLTGLSWLFYESFEFLYRLGGAAFFLVPRLFTLFFMGLGFMLMLSGAVTAYANLFQSPEIRRILTWPIPVRDLFYYNLVKSTLMSSWAFFFIIIPFIGAFGIYRDWNPLLLVWAALCSVPFVMLCSGLGVLVMLILMRWVPRGRTLALLAALSVVYAGYAGAGYMRDLQANQNEEMLVLVNFVPGLELASQPLMPNRWLAQAILAFAGADWVRGTLYFVLLTSSVGLLFLLLARLGSWIYPPTLQRQLVGATRWARKPSLLSRFLHGMLPGRHSSRAFAVKDTLIFLRDPSQWTQCLIFFGLLGLYFLNLGSLGYGDLSPVWSNLISFLNLFSLSAVMSSLSARFIFPQMSLESRTLWMVGLAPTSLPRMMLIKFMLAAFTLTLVGGVLSQISMSMLEVSPLSRLLGNLLMPCVAFTLAGMSAGLGAVFMELGDKTPAQILSGYGGTLNLILTLFTVILLVLVPGIVAHLITTETVPVEEQSMILPATMAYVVLLSGCAGGIPLWIGARTLARRDY